MQAWIYRATDLGVISKSAAVSLFRRFRANGWHKQEPGDPIRLKKPERMKRLVLRAVAEEIISESRAAELLGITLSAFRKEKESWHPIVRG